MYRTSIMKGMLGAVGLNELLSAALIELFQRATPKQVDKDQE